MTRGSRKHLLDWTGRVSRLARGLRSVRWYAADGELIYWQPGRSQPLLAQELNRVFGDLVDIQEGGTRQLESFYSGRQSLDALFPKWRIALEIVRRLHGNGDRTKLRIFVNEAIKPIAEQRRAGYDDFSPMVLHYFQPRERELYRAALMKHAAQTPAIQTLGYVFAQNPTPVGVPITDLLVHAGNAIRSGDSKDRKYWGEIERRAVTLREKGASVLYFTPEMSWAGGDGLPGAVLLRIHVT